MLRLWHKDMIRVLPRQQLLSQYRECCAIAKSIKEKGTPNHLLVNKIMDYPIEYFIKYTLLVVDEMRNRGYKVDTNKFDKYAIYNYELDCIIFDTSNTHIFPNWHNDRYYWQCYFNLQEKFDRGGISQQEWDEIQGACYDKFPFGYYHI